MRVLILCPHFDPDTAPTGTVMTSIVSELARLGIDMDVLTSLPWYRDHAIEPEWRGSWRRREITPWGSITRLHPFPSKKSSLASRALGFAGFTALITAQGFLHRGRPDLVLAMSPPISLGLAGAVVARRFRVPFVFNIQDVFPDVAIQLGVVSNPQIIRGAYALERWCYQRADAVTVLSDDLAGNVRAKLLKARTRNHPDKVRVIPNFVDTDFISPGPKENSYRAEFGLQGKRVVMYAGNVGLSQSFDLLVAAARHWVNDPSIHFVINGAGSGLEALKAATTNLPNVVFVGHQPMERLPELLAAADVHLVLLKTGLAASSVPSKSYSVLASGRPLLASIDVGSEVARMVEQAQAGRTVPPEDEGAFLAALEDLLSDLGECERLGHSGRQFVEEWASPAAVGSRYAQLFDEIAQSR